MDPTITSSIISVIGTLIATIIGKISFSKVASLFFRHSKNIPDMKGTRWYCKWIYEDGRTPIEDEIEILKWTKKSNFKGSGHQTRERVFDYPITGEVSPSRVVVLIYKADKYPEQANIGTASLQLDIRGENMNGYWCGLGSKKMDDGSTIYTLHHGQVKCTKLR